MIAGRDRWCLALIGLTNLITASLVGLRDHLRDVRVLRAMGLTPLQVLASLVAQHQRAGAGRGGDRGVAAGWPRAPA